MSRGSTRSHARGLRFLGAYAVVLASAQTLAITLSLVHVRIGQVVALAILAGSTILGGAYFARLAAPFARRSGRHYPVFARLGVVAIAAFAAGLFVLTAVAALTKPDFSWDGNSYHIPMIHAWARRGYIHWIEYPFDPGPQWAWFTHWLLNGYPKGAETISFLMVRAWGSSAPVNTNNLVFLPLGVAGISVAATSLGATRWSAAAAGAAFALVPIIVAQNFTSYVDASLASCIAGLTGCLAAVIPPLLRRRTPYELLPAFGSSIGLVASAKSSGIVPAALALLLTVVVASLAARGVGGLKRAARRVAPFAALAAGLAGAVAAYWYARAWHYTGNPMSPVRVTLLGREIFPGVPLRDAISEEFLTPPYMMGWPGWKQVGFTWLQGLHKWPESIRWYDPHEGGLGFLWVVACIPSMLAVMATSVVGYVRNRRGKVRLVVFACVELLIAISFAVTPMHWWSRYTMWIYAAGLPCLAVVIDRVVLARALTLRVGFGLWLAAAFSLAAYESWFTFRDMAFAQGFLAMDQSRPTSVREAAHRLVTYDDPKYFYRNFSPMDVEVVRSDETVALGPMNIGSGPLLGVLSMPVGLRDIVLFSEDIGRDEPRLRALCEQYHVRYVFWTDGELTPEPLLRLSHRQDRTEGYWRVFDVGTPRPGARHDVRAK